MCVRVCVCVAPPTCMNRADGFSTSMCFIDAAARCYGGLRAVGFIQPFKWARRRRIVSPLLTLNTLTTYCYSTSTTDSQNYPACSMSAMRNCTPPPLLRFCFKTPSERRSAAGSSGDTFLFCISSSVFQSAMHLRQAFYLLFFPFLPFHKLSSIKAQNEDDYRLLTRAAD